MLEARLWQWSDGVPIQPTLVDIACHILTRIPSRINLHRCGVQNTNITHFRTTAHNNILRLRNPNISSSSVTTCERHPLPVDTPFSCAPGTETTAFIVWWGSGETVQPPVAAVSPSKRKDVYLCQWQDQPGGVALASYWRSVAHDSRSLSTKRSELSAPARQSSTRVYNQPIIKHKTFTFTSLCAKEACVASMAVEHAQSSCCIEMFNCPLPPVSVNNRKCKFLQKFSASEDIICRHCVDCTK